VAELSFDVQELSHIANAVLVKMSGAIDASTVVNFQSTLENLQLKGTKRFILDMEGIKYVNSTGLGSLVRLADQLESDGGGFALVKIHPKVKVVFDMLGLNAFFKIFPSQENAEAHFAEKGGAAAGGGATAAAPPKPEPPKQATMKPRPVACQNCGVTLRIQQPGNFKCSKCSTLFTVDPTGQVKFHIKEQQAPAGGGQAGGQARPKPQPVQLNMVCNDVYVRGLAAFLGTVAQQFGFQPQRIQQLQTAIQEIAGHIRTDSYGGNQSGQFSVLVAPEQGVMNLKFADRGRTMTLQGNMYGQTRQIAANFDLKPHPQGGNLLTLRIAAS